MLGGLQQLDAGAEGSDQRLRIQHAKTAVAESVFASLMRIRQLLQRYDAAYADFIDNGRPATFRQFLLEAPRLFGELAQKTGGISHMLTFWECRFPNSVTSAVDGDELCAILQDFESGFAREFRGGEVIGHRRDPPVWFRAHTSCTTHRGRPQ